MQILMNNNITIYQVLVVDRQNRIVIMDKTATTRTELEQIRKEFERNIHHGKFCVVVRDGVHYKRGDKI